MRLRLWTYLWAGLLLLKLGIMAWSVDRGLDITDEGYHVLSYEHPEAEPTLQTHANRVVDFAFGWMPFTLVGGRVLRLILEVLGLALLCLGLDKLARHMGVTSGGSRWPVFLFAALGLGQSLFSRGLYYDYLNMFVVFTAAGLAFWAWTQTGGRRGLLLLLAGFMGGWLWMVKFPTAILLTVIMGLLPLMLGEKGLKGIALWLGAYMAGMALTLTFWCAAYAGPPLAYLQEYREGIKVYGLLGYNLQTILVSIYLPDVLETLALLAGGLVPFALLRWRVPSIPALAWGAGLAGFSLTLLAFDRPTYHYLTYAPQHSSWVHSVHLYPLVFLFLLSELWLQRQAVRTKGIMLRSLTWLCLVLWALPYCIMMGTDTVFSVSEWTHIAAWFPPLLLLLTVLWKHMPERLPGILLGGVTLLSTLQFGHFYIWRPYRVGGSLLEQTEWVQGKTDRLRVTPKVKQMLQESRALLDAAGYQEGDSVLAIHDMPGLLQMHGAYPAGAYWYFLAASSEAYDCHHIRRLQEQGRRPWLLVNEASAPACLRGFPHYDNDLHYAGSFKDAYQGGNVLIYAPRRVR